MKKAQQSVVGILVCLVVAGAVAWAGSDGGAEIWGVPVFAVCAALAFIINWIAFVPAYLRQTERFYDLTGSITYLTLVVIALLAGTGDARSLLLGALVAVWALRLGTFLVRRIAKDGSDGRFDRIKPDPARFLMTWTMQGLWVVMTLSCALAAMTAGSTPLGWTAGVGVAVWVAGFGIEAVADQQKRAFRADDSNDGRFIAQGLWAWSRHPNYFGEITLWIGVAVIAVPALSGWQYVTLISPVFVAVLLTRISGIPLLEARAEQRWGDEPEYRAHVERTSVLVPLPPKRSVAPKER